MALKWGRAVTQVIAGQQLADADRYRVAPPHPQRTLCCGRSTAVALLLSLCCGRFATVIPSLTTWARVKAVLATPLRGRVEFLGSAISLSRKGFAIRPKGSFFQCVRWTQGLTIHLFGTCSQHCCFELPHLLRGRQAAYSSARFLSSGHRMTRARLHHGPA